MELLTKAIALELKGEISDEGTFEGYGSTFGGQKDQGGDIVVKGAFGASLERWQKSGRVVPVLWQHQTKEPIGSWPNLAEDDHGLLGKAELWLADAPYARLAHKGMRSKTITGLSIGYRIKRAEMDKKAGARMLHELDLAEISVVTDPMNDNARVASVKSLTTIREFEGFLRDVGGFSVQQAKAIASAGWSAVDEARDESDEALAKTLDALSSFQLITP